MAAFFFGGRGGVIRFCGAGLFYGLFLRLDDGLIIRRGEDVSYLALGLGEVFDPGSVGGNLTLLGLLGLPFLLRILVDSLFVLGPLDFCLQVLDLVRKLHDFFPDSVVLVPLSFNFLIGRHGLIPEACYRVA